MVRLPCWGTENTDAQPCDYGNHKLVAFRYAFSPEISLVKYFSVACLKSYEMSIWNNLNFPRIPIDMQIVKTPLQIEIIIFDHFHNI